jgi:hypothetical protein
VANLKFSVALQDSLSGWTLTKLCTMGAANTWTLITLPNIPVDGERDVQCGTGGGGVLYVCGVGGGTTVTGTPDSWVAGGKIGATGMSNFASKAVNSTFDLGFVQHEPGDTCTALMDKRWLDNYDECLRYYHKTCNYEQSITSIVGAGGHKTFVAPGATLFGFGPVTFPKPMVKVPTITLYDINSGAANSVWDGAASHGSASCNAIGQTGFDYIGFATTTSGARQVYAHWKADCTF